MIKSALFPLPLAMLSICITGAEAQPSFEGYGRPVTDPAAISATAARFEADLRNIGIPATIEGCRLTEAVAVGVRNSETAYGAACKIRIAARPPREFIVCDSDLSGFGVLFEGSFVDNQDWMAGFIRKNCF